MGTNKKILIVDDDREFLEELREMLQLSGYDPVTVNNAEEAVAVARKTVPSLVIVDLKMPRKSGFQVADELRHIDAFYETPIIAMSAYYKVDYDPLLDVCGFARCLKKPFQPLDVIAEIEAVLAERQKGSLP